MADSRNWKYVYNEPMGGGVFFAHTGEVPAPDWYKARELVFIALAKIKRIDINFLTIEPCPVTTSPETNTNANSSSDSSKRPVMRSNGEMFRTNVPKTAKRKRDGAATS